MLPPENRCILTMGNLQSENLQKSDKILLYIQHFTILMLFNLFPCLGVSKIDHSIKSRTLQYRPKRYSKICMDITVTLVLSGMPKTPFSALKESF